MFVCNIMIQSFDVRTSGFRSPHTHPYVHNCPIGQNIDARKVILMISKELDEINFQVTMFMWLCDCVRLQSEETDCVLMTIIIYALMCYVVSCRVVLYCVVLCCVVLLVSAMPYYYLTKKFLFFNAFRSSDFWP